MTQHISINLDGGIDIWQKVLLVLTIAVGGLLVSVTSNNLGELGSKVMLLAGRLLLIGALIATLYSIFKKGILIRK